MVNLQRQNIVDLIRKNAYSSCIITSYSFDFIFFEDRLMPALKYAGVKNINLFLDGNYFDEQLENSIGKEFSGQRTYAVNTVYGEGIFHPKMIFLTGHTHALLIVGSGNVSTSGMSGNDEVWGAFQINAIDSPNAPILAQAWKYLQGFFVDAYGFNQDKIHWITQNSPWLKELQKLDQAGFSKVAQDLEAQFLKNEPGNPIYKQLVSLVSKENLEALTIISPFFDKNGSALVNFLNDFGLKKITCITDSQSGLLPSNIHGSLMSHFCFYEWKDCVEDFHESHNRLHAKMYHFRMKGNVEFLMIGSCNATLNALGSGVINARNEEVALLLRREVNSDYLSDLGISTRNASQIVLSEDFKPPSKADEIEPTRLHKYKIVHAELEAENLNLQLNHSTKSNCFLVIRNKFLEEVERQLISIGDSFSVKLSHPNEVLHVCLYDGENRVSNIRPIHNVYMLAKSNPDKNQADINELVDSIMNSGDFSSIDSILQHLEYAISDEESKSYSAANSSIARKPEKASREYSSLTEEEVYSLPSAHSYTREILNHPNVQFADLIALLGRGMIHPKDQNLEDIESSLTNEDPQGDYGEDKEVGVVQHQIDGVKIKESILKHNKRLYEYHDFLLQESIDKRDFRNAGTQLVSLNELSNFIILLGLLSEFRVKSFEVATSEVAIHYQSKWRTKVRKLERSFRLIKSNRVDRDDLNVSFYHVEKAWLAELLVEFGKIDEKMLLPDQQYMSGSYSFKYFNQANVNKEEKDSIKSMLVDSLGVFLLRVAASKGFRVYEFDSLNHKMSTFRDNLFHLSTALILNLNWTSKEESLRDILLLDIVHFIYPKKTEPRSLLNSIVDLTRIKSRFFESNILDYEKSVLLPYERWSNAFENDRQSISLPIDQLSSSSIIFRSEFGFAFYRKAKEGSMNIKKPGLWWYSDENECFEINYPQRKVITFSQ